MFAHCDGVTFPEFWKKYLLAVQETFTKHPEMNLPQILYPCHSFLQQAPDLVDMVPYLPPIIVWNTLVQFRYLFPQGLMCTVCKDRSPLRVKSWNIGADQASCPRMCMTWRVLFS